MKKNVYIAAALCLSGMMSSCHKEPSFTIEGEISGAADKMLYFEQSGLTGVTALDSVKLGKNGSFSFSGARPDSPDFFRLRTEDGKVINLSIDSTETVKITADLDKFATEYTVEGSDNCSKIKELTLLQSDLQAQVSKLSTSGQPIGVTQDSIVKTIETFKDKIKKNYIFVQPNKAYAYYALFLQVNGYMIFDPLNSKDDVKCFAAVATSLNNDYPHADRSCNLYNMVIKGMKNTRKPQAKPLEIPADKIQETSILDIPLMDIKGQTRHLTDLKGKVVLIDFTAYGTPESGARNLVLRDLYNKYASQGFEIYQVSLDSDEHFWKTAADNLPWICVRDPQGPYSTYVKLYGVTAIPTAFIVNRNNELSLRLGEKTNLEEAIKKFL